MFFQKVVRYCSVLVCACGGARVYDISFMAMILAVKLDGSYVNHIP